MDFSLLFISGKCTDGLFPKRLHAFGWGETALAEENSVKSSCKMQQSGNSLRRLNKAKIHFEERIFTLFTVNKANFRCLY